MKVRSLQLIVGTIFLGVCTSYFWFSKDFASDEHRNRVKEDHPYFGWWLGSKTVFWLTRSVALILFVIYTAGMFYALLNGDF